jgi:hypothetical protein
MPLRETATPRKALPLALAVPMLAATFGALPADAARKQKPRSLPETPPSLDGRVLGYPRTCGYEYFQYSTTGTPVGPYCH